MGTHIPSITAHAHSIPNFSTAHVAKITAVSVVNATEISVCIAGIWNSVALNHGYLVLLSTAPIKCQYMQKIKSINEMFS